MRAQTAGEGASRVPANASTMEKLHRIRSTRIAEAYMKSAISEDSSSTTVIDDPSNHPYKHHNEFTWDDFISHPQQQQHNAYKSQQNQQLRGPKALLHRLSSGVRTASISTRRPSLMNGYDVPSQSPQSYTRSTSTNNNSHNISLTTTTMNGQQQQQHRASTAAPTTTRIGISTPSTTTANQATNLLEQQQQYAHTEEGCSMKNEGGKKVSQLLRPKRHHSIGWHPKQDFFETKEHAWLKAIDDEKATQSVIDDVFNKTFRNELRDSFQNRVQLNKKFDFSIRSVSQKSRGSTRQSNRPPPFDDVASVNALREMSFNHVEKANKQNHFNSHEVIFSRAAAEKETANDELESIGKQGMFVDVQQEHRIESTMIQHEFDLYQQQQQPTIPQRNNRSISIERAAPGGIADQTNAFNETGYSLQSSGTNAQQSWLRSFKVGQVHTEQQQQQQQQNQSQRLTPLRMHPYNMSPAKSQHSQFNTMGMLNSIPQSQYGSVQLSQNQTQLMMNGTFLSKRASTAAVSQRRTSLGTAYNSESDREQVASLKRQYLKAKENDPLLNIEDFEERIRENDLNKLPKKVKKDQSYSTQSELESQDQTMKSTTNRQIKSQHGFCGLSRIEGKILVNGEGIRKVRMKKQLPGYPYCLAFNPY